MNSYFFTNLSQMGVFFMSNTKVIQKLVFPHKITLYKNGNNPNIYYYFTYNHKMYRGSTGKSDLKSSTEEVFDIFYEVKTGKRTNGSRGSNDFDKVCKKYIEYKHKENKLSPRTLIEYERNSKFLLKKFGNENIENLCDKNVYTEYQEWRRSFYQTYPNENRKKYKRNGKHWLGKKYENVGSVPINRELRLLVSILRYSKYELKLLPNIDIPPYTRLNENEGKKILKDDQFEKLRDFMKINRPFQWSIISFINSTGIRYPSELLRIKWKDIDWDTPCVWIRNRKNPRKDGKSVDTPVPLLGKGLEVIKTLWERDNIPKGENDPVFVNDDGIQVKNIRKSFKYCLDKVGIDKTITIYGFRSRFTTQKLFENTNVVILSKVLGHRSTDMVMKHYESLDKDHFLETFEDSREEYYRRKDKKQKQKEQQNTTNVEQDVQDFVSK